MSKRKRTSEQEAAAKQPTNGNVTAAEPGGFKNREKVLILSTRGITHRCGPPATMIAYRYVYNSGNTSVYSAQRGATGLAWVSGHNTRPAALPLAALCLSAQPAGIATS